MQEYYIRNPDSDESRGPFTVEQLNSLAETGHISLETLVYDPEKESWEVLEESETLRPVVFPERKKLTMKAKLDFESLNKSEVELKPITVDDLLAAAEGETDDTRHKKRSTVWRERFAVGAMYIGALAFLFSALGLLWIEREIIFAFELGEIITSPLAIFAIADLAIAFLLFLQTTAVYPFIRFRAMVGAGFFLFFFWAAGEPVLLWASVAGYIGLFGITLFLQTAPFLIFAALALFGMIGFVVFSFLG